MNRGPAHWAHPLVLAWREVFGRRHPNHRHRPRSRRRDLAHAVGHVRFWLGVHR